MTQVWCELEGNTKRRWHLPLAGRLMSFLEFYGWASNVTRHAWLGCFNLMRSYVEKAARSLGRQLCTLERSLTPAPCCTERPSFLVPHAQLEDTP